MVAILSFGAVRRAPARVPSWDRRRKTLSHGRGARYGGPEGRSGLDDTVALSGRFAPGARPGASPRAQRRHQRRHGRRQFAVRAALLVGAIGLPTVAAQGQWATSLRSAIGFGDERVALTPMPFETPGESFPGSAFYFLEDAPRLATDLSDLREDEGVLETVEFAESHGAGAAAQAFRQAGNGLDKARALQCLSMAVYYEAASESYEGQQAVAQVVLNRVAHPAYPASVCGVVFQGSERKTGCQFSFTCDGSMRRIPSRQGWARAQSVALGALAGGVFRPIGLATHYHTNYVNPYWAASLDLVGTIGAHRFYRWKGGAGRAGAFSQGYAGTEPLAAAGTRQSVSETSQSAGAAMPPPNSALGTDGKADAPVGAAAPAVRGDMRGDTLPLSGQVKKEYANSGRWIREPGKTQ